MKSFGNIFEKQLANLRQQQEILAILIFSLVTCLLWVSIDLITSQQRTTISPQLQKLAQPLNPTINQDIINELQQKRSYEENELASFPIYKVISAKDRATQIRAQSTETAGDQGSTRLETLTSSFLDPEPEAETATDSADADTSLVDTALPPSDEATSSSNSDPNFSSPESGEAEQIAQ